MFSSKCVYETHQVCIYNDFIPNDVYDKTIHCRFFLTNKRSTEYLHRCFVLLSIASLLGKKKTAIMKVVQIRSTLHIK